MIQGEFPFGFAPPVPGKAFVTIATPLKDAIDLATSIGERNKNLNAFSLQ
jgi:hypothetical protein